jgi:formylglycine-generating enzyme required for sulfatase activity
VKTSMWLKILILFQTIVTAAFANNISISNVGLVGRNISAGNNNPANFGFVKFDLQWENSWRTNDPPGNWDAAWIFAKYRIASGAWQHATLHPSFHRSPSGSTITPSSDGKGAFIYRRANGSGTVSFTSTKLRWDYGADGVLDTNHVTIKVFAVEMVYVSTDSFYVGSGGQEEGTFTDGSWNGGNTTPFLISSENAISIDSSAGSLWRFSNSWSTTADIGPAGILSANYPNGFHAFYCMKYSISQKQYADFLNSLTYDQQTTRTEVPPNSAAGTLAMTTFSPDRNGIKIMVPGVASAVPAVYGCDLNGNGIFYESDDGQDISCNWLSWADGIAYCDWAAIRPMTELEFEKACRGPLDVFQYERPYGNMVVAHSVSITNAGYANESAVPDTGSWNAVINGATNINAGGAQWGLLDYPVRVGIYATDTSNRTSSGATYYGILDMGGDVWERVVTVGNLKGRAFAGTHGDGKLDSLGNETGNNDWPGTDAEGSGFRGGAFNYDSDFARTSDRAHVTLTDSLRYEESHQAESNGQSIEYGFRGTYGFRGIRTAP